MRSFSHSIPRNTARWPTVLFTFLVVIVAWSLPALARKPNGQPEILVQAGHSFVVDSSHFSPDGTRLLTGGWDGIAILWDVATGRKLRTFYHADSVQEAVFSPDGSRALSCSRDGLAIYWNVTTGEKLRTFWHENKYKENEKDAAYCVAIDPQGRRCAVGFVGNVAIVYDLETGESLLTLKTSGTSVLSVEFSHDGSKILTSGTDGKAQLWDAEGRVPLRMFHCGTEWVHDAVFSPDDRLVLTAGGRRKSDKEGGLAEMILWDATSGEQVHRFEGHTAAVYSVAFSNDGGSIASASSDGSFIAWDANDFRERWSLPPSKRGAYAVAFSPDSQTLLAGLGNRIRLYDVQTGRVTGDFPAATGRVSTVVPSGDGRRLFFHSRNNGFVEWDLASGRILRTFDSPSKSTSAVAISGVHSLGLVTTADKGVATLWDLEQRRLLRRLEGHTDRIVGVALSPDGRTAATSSIDLSIVVWETATGRRLRTIRLEEPPSVALAFSPDSKYLLSGGAGDDSFHIYDLQSGRLERSLQGHDWWNRTAAFSPDGVQLAGGSDEGPIIIWDWKTGRRLQALQGHKSPVAALAFNADGSRLLSGCEGNKVMLWDTRTGELLRTMEGHSSQITSVAFCRDDERMAISCGGDGTSRLWDLTNGEELLRLMDWSEGPNWLAITPEGLFDGSKGGREKVNFRVGEGLKVVPVDRFFQDFYQPGLLLTIWNGGRPLPEIELGGDAPPTLRLLSPSRGASDSRDVTIEVEAVDAGNGISRWALYQNGARVLAPGESRPKGKATIRTFKVSLVEGENRFRITATNADGSWEAEPVQLTLSYQRPLSKPELYVVAVGINRYAQETMNLKFAVSDAKAVAALFRKRGAALYAKVNVTELVDQKATRAGIQKALQAVAAKAQPQDTLLVFFAGHGTMVQQRYYFVPHEFTAKAGSLEADIRKQALPVDELGDWLAAVPSLKRMLIFDTCQSGGVLGLSKGARNPFALRGAIERLSRAQGVFTIAAAASTADAQEIPELKHGALTYALLAGLGAIDEGPLAETKIRTNDPDEVVDVLQWFSFASGQVPRLTAELLGSAQDVQTSGEGMSFPVLPIVQ